MVGEGDDRKEVTQDCTCPALVIRAQGPPGPEMPHLMMWSRGELARLRAKFDEGYFDDDECPPRRVSLFMSAVQAELLDMLDRDPLHAFVYMLTRVKLFDRVTLGQGTYGDGSRAQLLSLRLMPGHWAVIGLPCEPDQEITYQHADQPGGENPALLWERPESRAEQVQTEEDIRQQVRGMLHGTTWERSTQETSSLVDDEGELKETLDQLHLAAERIEREDASPAPLPVDVPKRGRRKAAEKKPVGKRRLPPDAGGKG